MCAGRLCLCIYASKSPLIPFICTTGIRIEEQRVWTVVVVPVDVFPRVRTNQSITILLPHSYTSIWMLLTTFHSRHLILPYHTSFLNQGLLSRLLRKQWYKKFQRSLLVSYCLGYLIFWKWKSFSSECNWNGYFRSFQRNSATKFQRFVDDKPNVEKFCLEVQKKRKRYFLLKLLVSTGLVLQGFNFSKYWKLANGIVVSQSTSEKRNFCIAGGWFNVRKIKISIRQAFNAGTRWLLTVC